jgi:hypothetical protein
MSSNPNPSAASGEAQRCPRCDSDDRDVLLGWCRELLDGAHPWHAAPVSPAPPATVECPYCQHTAEQWLGDYYRCSYCGMSFNPNSPTYAKKSESAPAPRPETPGAEPGLSDALRFVLAADEIDRLRQELESAHEQLAAKDEALSQIKFIASLTDGKCKWDHKEQFELIVSMARVALKESQESKKV